MLLLFSAILYTSSLASTTFVCSSGSCVASSNLRPKSLPPGGMFYTWSSCMNSDGRGVYRMQIRIIINFLVHMRIITVAIYA